MKTTSKVVKGTAYLVGGSKEATGAVVDALVAQFKGKPEERTRIKADYLKALTEEFEFTLDGVKEPETIEEAAKELANGMETIRKQVCMKVITNQLDDARNKRAKEIVDAADVASKIGAIVAAKK